MKTLAIIYNPESGRGLLKKALPEVVKRLEAKGFTCNIHPTEYAGHASELYFKANQEGCDRVLISGGDGTIHEVVQTASTLSNPTPLVYCPSGTACDLARTLGIPKNPLKALELMDDQNLAYMDIGQTLKRSFVYVSAVGHYVDISYKADQNLKRMFGFFAYILVGIKSFFKVSRIPAVLVVDDQTINTHFSLILILNSRYVANFDVVKNPQLDDGVFNVIAFPYKPFLNNLFFLAVFVFRRRHIPGVYYFQGKSIIVETEEKQVWTQDGEKGDVGTQKIHILSRKLPIYINPIKRSLFTQFDEKTT